LKNTTDAPEPVCKRCGTCCRKSGPALHTQDLGLFEGKGALALSMINRFGDVIGLKSKSVTVYSEWEEQFLLRDVRPRVFSSRRRRRLQRCRRCSAAPAW